MSTFLLKTTIKSKGVKAALRSFESELKKREDDIDNWAEHFYDTFLDDAVENNGLNKIEKDYFLLKLEEVKKINNNGKKVGIGLWNGTLMYKY